MGAVYIMTNESMPGLCKIGYSCGDLKERASALYNTSVPFPFKVVYSVGCSEPSRVERRAHKKLEHCRCSPSREFFRCSQAEAQAAIEDAIDLMNKWKKIPVGYGEYPIGCLRIDTALRSLLDAGLTLDKISDFVEVRGIDCHIEKLLEILEGNVPDYPLGVVIEDAYRNFMPRKKRS